MARGKYEHDIFLLSFPKAGRTWLTILLGRALQLHFGLHKANPLKLRKLADSCPQLPSIFIAHDDRPQWKRPHELSTDKEVYRGKKVIFMVRDPRDLLISNFFQKKKRITPRKFLFFFHRRRRIKHEPFAGELPDFLNHDEGGFDTMLRYFNIWAEKRDVPAEFLCVRYEDMKADPARELVKVLEFIGVRGVSDDAIKSAVEFASFDNMKQMEKTNALGSSRLRPHDSKDPDSYKVRKGKVGGYADYLTHEQIDGLNRKMRSTLTDFYGYIPNIARSE